MPVWRLLGLQLCSFASRDPVRCSFSDGGSTPRTPDKVLNQAGVSVEAVRLAAVESGISCHNNGLAHRHLAALQQQKQQLAAQVQQLQDAAAASCHEVQQLQAEIGRLRSKVHQRGFEVLTQQQLLQVAQQQLKKTRQQLQEQQQAAAADSAAAATARLLFHQLEGLACRAGGYVQHLEAAAAAAAAGGPSQACWLAAGMQCDAAGTTAVMSCLEVLEGLLTLAHSSKQLTATAAAGAATGPTTAAAAGAAARGSSCQPSTADPQQVLGNTALPNYQHQQQHQQRVKPFLCPTRHRHASCPQTLPSAAAAAAIAPHSQGQHVLSRSSSSGNNSLPAHQQLGQQQQQQQQQQRSTSSFLSRSMSPDFLRIAEGVELMGPWGNHNNAGISSSGSRNSSWQPASAAAAAAATAAALQPPQHHSHRGTRSHSGNCSQLGKYPGHTGLYAGSHMGSQGHSGIGSRLCSSCSSNGSSRGGSSSGSGSPCVSVAGQAGSSEGAAPLARLKALRASAAAAAAVGIGFKLHGNTLAGPSCGQGNGPSAGHGRQLSVCPGWDCILQCDALAPSCPQRSTRYHSEETPKLQSGTQSPWQASNQQQQPHQQQQQQQQHRGFSPHNARLCSAPARQSAGVLRFDRCPAASSTSSCSQVLATPSLSRRIEPQLYQGQQQQHLPPKYYQHYHQQQHQHQQHGQHCEQQHRLPYPRGC